MSRDNHRDLRQQKLNHRTTDATTDAPLWASPLPGCCRPRAGLGGRLGRFSLVLAAA